MEENADYQSPIMRFSGRGNSNWIVDDLRAAEPGDAGSLVANLVTISLSSALCRINLPDGFDQFIGFGV